MPIWRHPTNWSGPFPSGPPNPPPGKLSYNDWYAQTGGGIQSVSFGSAALNYLQYLGDSGTGTTPPNQSPPSQPTPQPTSPVQSQPPGNTFYQPQIPSYGPSNFMPNSGTSLYTPQQYQSPLNSYLPFQYLGPG